MNHLIREVDKHQHLLASGRKGVFFIKDGDNWTAEPGLSKRNRDKFEGVYIKPGEVKDYQTKIGMALYIERKYYGHSNIEDPNGVLSQLNWIERASL